MVVHAFVWLDVKEPIYSCADCRLGYSVVKYKSRSVHGHVEDRLVF